MQQELINAEIWVGFAVVSFHLDHRYYHYVDFSFTYPTPHSLRPHFLSSLDRHKRSPRACIHLKQSPSHWNYGVMAVAAPATAPAPPCNSHSNSLYRVGDGGGGVGRCTLTIVRASAKARTSTSVSGVPHSYHWQGSRPVFVPDHLPSSLYHQRCRACMNPEKATKWKDSGEMRERKNRMGIGKCSAVYLWPHQVISHNERMYWWDQRSDTISFCDTSKTGVGAILYQLHDRPPRALLAFVVIFISQRKWH